MARNKQLFCQTYSFKSIAQLTDRKGGFLSKSNAIFVSKKGEVVQIATVLCPVFKVLYFLALLGTLVTISWKSLSAENHQQTTEQNKTTPAAQLTVTTPKQPLPVLLLHFFLFI